MNPADKEDLKSMVANSLLEIEIILDVIGDCIGCLADDLKEINTKLGNQ